MPALPADAAALRAQHERISETHPPEWVERTEAIAATWDIDTIVGMIRADFTGVLSGETG